MSQESELLKIARALQQLSAQDNVNEIIALLNSKTAAKGPIHPDNETELNIWNLPGYAYFLRQGKYEEAERIFQAFYENLLKNQDYVGRVHKGMALHNLGLSLFFQGKTEDAIKFFICAYIEDAIRGKGSLETEQLPASRVLRGFCGVPQSDLFKIRDFTVEVSCEEIPLRPESIYESQKIKEVILGIQRNYKEYIPETWKWERDGQRYLEKGEYEKSYSIYLKWFDALLKYQKSIAARVHKGHPLFNAGISRFLQGNSNEAIKLLLLAYIEDVVSAFRVGESDKTAAFRNLSSIIQVSSLKDIEKTIFQMKSDAKSVDDPVKIIENLAGVEEKARKEFEETKKGIQDSKEKTEKEFVERISEKKEITDELDGTFYVLKRWNSITPRYPQAGPSESYGGGYFIIWNKKGIVVDPGYDFLRFFYKEGFGVLNIDLIIVTHAHDDHCQDLEAIFSVLHKLNVSGYAHNIDLVISEGVQIKYSRLLTIMRQYVHDVILQPSHQIDPSTISGKQYDVEVRATMTNHHEEPWMKNNTGFGLLVSFKKDNETIFRIGLTGDTAFWNGIEREFELTDLLVEHIGTFGSSNYHLTDVGCIELLQRVQTAPRLVVVSEFGEELRSNRVNVCTLIETVANRFSTQNTRVPVFAGDVDLKIKIPGLKIFCAETGRFEDYTEIVDKEIRGNVEYVKKE